MFPRTLDPASGAPPDLQRAYRRYDAQTRQTNLRVWSFLALLLIPAGSILEFAVYPDRVSTFLTARLVASGLTALVFASTYTSIGRRFYRFLSLLLPLIPAFMIGWMISQTEGAASPYYAGLNLVLVAVGVIFPWTYLENLLVGALVMIIYLASCFVHGSLQGSGILVSNLFFLISTDLIVVVASYFQSHLRFREFSLRWQLNRNRQELEESNRRLTELNRIRTRFFANISHELRTPLTLLLTPVEAFRSKSDYLRLPEEAREICETVRANGLRLLKLINELLDLVKLESGRMEINRQAVEIQAFLQGIAASFQRLAQERRIELGWDVPPSIPILSLDTDKMEKILFNLLSNALKFTPAGGKVTLRANYRENLLILEIEDTGIGIPPEQKKFLFDPFWQADNSTVRRSQGTGIGLSLVKEFTEVLGGRVEVESVPKKGSCFRVLLPAQACEKPDVPFSSAEEASSEDIGKKIAREAQFAGLAPALSSFSTGEAPLSFGRRPILLVADDEPDLRRFLVSQLKKDYEVIEAADGREALEHAKQYLPSLILLDLMMPELDGMEVCRLLRANIATAAIPVIMLTAWADESTKLQALSAGVDDFLAKPFSSTELHLRVANLLAARTLQRELAKKNKALQAALEQLKENEAQLVQSEKMAALGRLAAGLVHEINNPLNFTTTAVQLLKRKTNNLPAEKKDFYETALKDIHDGLERVQYIIRDLMDFTHQHSERKETVSLLEIIQAARRFLEHEFKEGAPAFFMEIPEDTTVFGSKSKLIQVFLNLFQNALDALKEKTYAPGESPYLKVSCRSFEDNVEVVVEDNGLGIPDENKEKIFEPFFTTKDVGKGMGLGLSISYGIIQEHHGRLQVESEPGVYTRFLLVLPIEKENIPPPKGGKYAKPTL